MTTSTNKLQDRSITPKSFCVPLPPCPASGNYWSIFCPYSCAFSRMLQKWNHTMCGLLSLTSHILHNAFEICPYCCMYLWFVSFYCWVVFHCSDVPQFVHSLVEGHSGCFQFLAVTTKATIRICRLLYEPVCFCITLKWACWVIMLSVCFVCFFCFCFL